MSIALRGITKSFQGVTVIPPLTIEFSSRAFTTLLRMIAGLETPDAGEILFDGKPVFSADLGLNLPPEKRNIGFVFQDFALWPHLTVFENVAFPLRARKDLSDLKSKVTDALSLVGLADFAGRRVSEPKSRSKPSRYSSENDVLIEKSVKYTDFFLLSIVYV